MSLINSFHFELVSPKRCIFSGEVKSVILPSESGDMTALFGHSAVLVTMKPGIITVAFSCGDAHRYVVIGGVCDIMPSRCTVLTETVFSIDQVCLKTLENRMDETRDVLGSIYDSDQRSQLEQFLVDLSYLYSRVRDKSSL